jgi:hypothetical protein
MPTNGPLIDVTNTVEAMNANLSNLEHNTEYTLQDLVGKERWLATPSGHRKQLGVPFKALAKSDELPVRWVDRKDNNSQVYELK